MAAQEPVCDKRGDGVGGGGGKRREGCCVERVRDREGGCWL